MGSALRPHEDRANTLIPTYPSLRIIIFLPLSLMEKAILLKPVQFTVSTSR